MSCRVSWGDRSRAPAAPIGSIGARQALAEGDANEDDDDDDDDDDANYDGGGGGGDSVPHCCFRSLMLRR